MTEDWVKTVLTAKEAAIIQFPILKSAVGVKWKDYLEARHNKVLKAQAKATWEAREPEIAVAYQAGIKKGRQEVVEWVEQRRYTHLFDLPGWEAIKKEWGLE